MSAAKDGKIRCDACPVMCFIADGKAGACDRYANEGGILRRTDPHRVISIAAEEGGGGVVPFLDRENDGNWDGDLLQGGRTFVTAIGAGTTYPDYKPAPFIVGQQVDGVDMVTVVTEGIYSYCGVKVKIDTDRHIGPEQQAVRAEGEVIGHVTTGEYGSQMLSIGGVNHLTGGSKKQGRVTCDSMMKLCNREPVELTIDDGLSIVVQSGSAPVIDGVKEEKMRVGCGSATIGMFASQWQGLVDEVVVVDDHITGVVSEHQAGKVIDWQPTGIKVLGRKSTPGRYFQVAEPGTGWGGTDIDDPLRILGPFNKKHARAGQTLLMVSTTGEQHGFYVLDENLQPVEQQLPHSLVQSVELIAENCEPALCSVLFMGGAGGSLRAGVTQNPVRLTQSVKHALTHVTCGGAPAYVWPGGGITFMVDVQRMPANSFGYVPTPALVAPVEFTMRREDYVKLGGHEGHINRIEEVLAGKVGSQNDHALSGRTSLEHDQSNPWPLHSHHYAWSGNDK